MTAITYTAKRELVKTGFSVQGIDLSVSDTDRSINSVTTDLTGLLDNEWYDVQGYSANQVNNGFFQVNGNSTVNKIIQDSSINTISEAAGDVVSIDGYFHAAGLDYSLETASHEILISDKAIIKNAKALDGTSETIYTRNDVVWNFMTDFIDEVEFPLWREFFRSVQGGEFFTIDPYGSLLSPDQQLPVEIVGNPVYSNPFVKAMQVSFKVREL